MAKFNHGFAENGGYAGVPADATADPTLALCNIAILGFGEHGAKPAVDHAGNSLAWYGSGSISTARGRYQSSSIYFSANTQLIINYGAKTDPSGKDFTLRGWVNFPSTSGIANVVQFVEAATLYPSLIVTRNGTSLQVLGLTSSSSLTYWVNGMGLGSVSADTWYYWEFVRRAGAYYTYLNGVLMDYYVQTAGPYTGNNLFIMGNSGTALPGMGSPTGESYQQDFQFLPFAARTSGITTGVQCYDPPARASLNRYPTGAFATSAILPRIRTGRWPSAAANTIIAQNGTVAEGPIVLITGNGPVGSTPSYPDVGAWGTNTIGWANGANINSAPAGGLYPTAIVGDGVDNGVSVAISPLNIVSGFTLRARVYPTNVAGGGQIVGITQDAGNFISLAVTSSGFLRFYMRQNGTNMDVNASINALSNNAWYDVEVSVSQSAVYMYSQGASVYVGALPFTLSNGPWTSPFFHVVNGALGPLAGYAQDAAFYQWTHHGTGVAFTPSPFGFFEMVG